MQANLAPYAPFIALGIIVAIWLLVSVVARYKSPIPGAKIIGVQEWMLDYVDEDRTEKFRGLVVNGESLVSEGDLEQVWLTMPEEVRVKCFQDQASWDRFKESILTKRSYIEVMKHGFHTTVLITPSPTDQVGVTCRTLRDVTVSFPFITDLTHSVIEVREFAETEDWDIIVGSPIYRKLNLFETEPVPVFDYTTQDALATILGFLRSAATKLKREYSWRLRYEDLRRELTRVLADNRRLSSELTTAKLAVGGRGELTQQPRLQIKGIRWEPVALVVGSAMMMVALGGRIGLDSTLATGIGAIIALLVWRFGLSRFA